MSYTQTIRNNKKFKQQLYCISPQIYSQYVEVSDSLQQEKDENTRLKQYLDQILKVIIECVAFISKPAYMYSVPFIIVY